MITFDNITERKRVADDLKSTKQMAQTATLAKTRFLASASHDLRQPLQSLSLIQGMLGKIVRDPEGQELVGKLETIVETMSSMLNTLLDINQIEAGSIDVRTSVFAVDDVLSALKGEFAEVATARNLSLHVVRSSHFIESDPRLLKQMTRNLLSNAIKYTEKGKVLLGCRKKGKFLSIEVWDTGKGIPDGELDAIFEEYYQLDNTARERDLGLGLGLSIVRRIGTLLGHEVKVRSRTGRGSVFSIEIPLATRPLQSPGKGRMQDPLVPSRQQNVRATILVIEDEPEVRELLSTHLRREGHTVVSVRTGRLAIDRVRLGGYRPDLILTDFSLPEGMNGLEATDQIWKILGTEDAVVVLTGAISNEILRDIALHNCAMLSKPVKFSELDEVIQRHLISNGRRPSVPITSSAPRRSVIHLVDDDQMILDSVSAVLKTAGHDVRCFATAEAFLDAFKPGENACLLVDAGLPGMSGLELMRKLKSGGQSMPCIMITGNSDVKMAVDAMKAGAVDFIEKPFTQPELLTIVSHALESAHDLGRTLGRQIDAQRHLAALTPPPARDHANGTRRSSQQEYRLGSGH